MSEWAIETNGLTKIYAAGRGNELRALDGLSMRVPRGAVYGYLGRNGAGKTTTIKLLAGLARPTAGSARLLGMDFHADRIAILERAAFVGERKVLYDTMTAEELLRFTAAFYSRWSREAVERYARRLELPLTQPFRKLSLGNRTKVCLLLALAQGAELLVLDEPTAGLDPVMMDELARILVEDQAAEGRTVFLSSHQLAEVEQICDWVGVIDRGRLLLEAPLDDIRGQFRAITAAGTGLPEARSEQVISCMPSERFVRYVVSRDAEAFAAELRRQGATITDVSPLSLREIFLELVRKEASCTSENSGEIIASVSSST